MQSAMQFDGRPYTRCYCDVIPNPHSVSLRRNFSCSRVAVTVSEYCFAMFAAIEMINLQQILVN